MINSCDLNPTIVDENIFRRIQFGTANKAIRSSHSSRNELPWFAPYKQNDSLENQKKSKHRRLIRFHWSTDFDQVSSTHLLTRHIDPVELLCVQNRKFQLWFFFKSKNPSKSPNCIIKRHAVSCYISFFFRKMIYVRVVKSVCVCMLHWWLMIQFFVYISNFSLRCASKFMSLISFDQFDSNN